MVNLPLGPSIVIPPAGVVKVNANLVPPYKCKSGILIHFEILLSCHLLVLLNRKTPVLILAQE